MIQRNKGIDLITKHALDTLFGMYPKSAIRLSHQFLDGTEGHAAGFVPHDYNRTSVIVDGQWWNINK